MNRSFLPKAKKSKYIEKTIIQWITLACPLIRNEIFLIFRQIQALDSERKGSKDLVNRSQRISDIPVPHPDALAESINPRKNYVNFQLSTNCNAEAEETFNYIDYSKKVLSVINDLRKHPKKYVEVLRGLIKNIDRHQNVLDLSEKHNIKILLPPNTNYNIIVEFLDSIESKEYIMWTESLAPLAYEDLQTVLKDRNGFVYGKNENDDLKHFKILVDFVTDPEVVVLATLLLHPENREIIFSDYIVQGVVIARDDISSSCHKKEAKTFLFFTSQ